MAAELSKKQFDLVARLIRSRDPVRTAAYLVLVKGKSNQDAMSETGVSAASLSNTLTRYRTHHTEILKVYA
jgi:hypothetical protein